MENNIVAYNMFIGFLASCGTNRQHPMDIFSRSITAPMALAQSQPQVIVQESKDLKEIIARLNERLDEPFVTVNTVTGDKGIKQAQDEYQRLMNNKIVIK